MSTTDPASQAPEGAEPRLEMERRAFAREGLTLSFLDAGGEGAPLLALHAHWMEGRTFEALAAALLPAWRVIAPDQRGHGFSDHAPSYRREDYLGDLVGLLDHLGLGRAAVLGNSLGGVNAYQFAARHPERVTALIVEDIGAVIADDTTMALSWAGVFPTRGELEARVGPRLAPALASSLRETAQGWRLAFDPRDTVASQEELNGDHWADWLASTCPALMLRGRSSRVTDAQHLRGMAERRPLTRFQEVDGGHCPHLDDPAGFAAAVHEFLASLDAW